MKKLLLFSLAVVAMMAVSCQNAGNGGQETTKEDNQPTEAAVKQAVEQMMLMNVDKDADKILTAEMHALQQQAFGVHYEGDYFMGFQWNTGVLDVCSENAETTIEGVKLVDSLHAEVDMRYLDEGCYDETYVLHLLNEGGQWKIDDVDYQVGTLREECKAFQEEVADLYATRPVEEVLACLLGEEPTEENYSDPASIYYNNPEALKELADILGNCLELFKKNPGYTDEMGQQVEAMIGRIKARL